ncbi:sigma-70 family RNA polymerase sigma factor [candidate division KSB1 bacterium]|nr:sigma-70 family RNA polymerase sigma factor [bacterium]NUM65181.1 sigma-70 family RNA polymerase sigma factor [candidate division KSB1 bacterium]
MTTRNSERNNADWLAALGGEGSAVQETLRDLTSILRRNLSRAFRNRAGVDDAIVEDFVQEALVKITNNLNSFRGDSQFTTWATVIAVRTAMTILRRAHWKNVSLDQVALDRLEHGELRPTQEQDSQRQEAVELLYKLIENLLTSRQREAVLGSLAGVPQAILMERLGLNRNSLYKLEHDARKKLRAGLERNGICAEDVRELFHE